MAKAIEQRDASRGPSGSLRGQNYWSFSASLFLRSSTEVKEPLHSPVFQQRFDLMLRAGPSGNRADGPKKRTLPSLLAEGPHLAHLCVWNRTFFHDGVRGLAVNPREQNALTIGFRGPSRSLNGIFVEIGRNFLVRASVRTPFSQGGRWRVGRAASPERDRVWMWAVWTGPVATPPLSIFAAIGVFAALGRGPPPPST